MTENGMDWSTISVKKFDIGRAAGITWGAWTESSNLAFAITVMNFTAFGTKRNLISVINEPMGRIQTLLRAIAPEAQSTS